MLGIRGPFDHYESRLLVYQARQSKRRIVPMDLELKHSNLKNHNH